jgi:hypothetical protein
MTALMICFSIPCLPWVVCTGISLLIEYFVLKYPFLIKYFVLEYPCWLNICTGIYWLNISYWNIPTGWVFCTGIFLTDWIFCTGIFLTDWMVCTGISLLTEYFVLEYSLLIEYSLRIFDVFYLTITFDVFRSVFGGTWLSFPRCWLSGPSFQPLPSISSFDFHPRFYVPSPVMQQHPVSVGCEAGSFMQYQVCLDDRAVLYRQN